MIASFDTILIPKKQKCHIHTCNTGLYEIVIHTKWDH